MQRSGWRVGLGGLPTLGWCCVQGPCAVPCVCSLYLRNGAEFLVFLHLISHALPQVSITQLFLVPCSFLVFRCSRRHSSMCKHCSKGSLGPRSQLLTQTSTEASPASSLQMLHLGPHPRPTESLDDSKALTPWEALL